MTQEIVRVLRVVSIVGPRAAVEQQMMSSLKGTKVLPNGVKITSVTIDEFPELLGEAEEVEGETGARRFSPIYGKYPGMHRPDSE